MLSEQQLDQLDNLYHEGIQAKDAEDGEAAKRRFDACILLDDGATPSPGEEQEAYELLFFAYLFRAQFYEEEKNYEKAIELAKRGLANQRLKGHALRILGTCYANTGRLKDAEDAYREGLAGASTPEERVWWYVFLFSVVHQDGTRQGEAKKLLEEALELDPAYEETHYNYAVMLIEEGDLESAGQHLETAIQLDPDYGFAHGKLGELYLRKIHRGGDPQREGDKVRASEHHLTRSIELKPECLTTRLHLANLHWTCKRYRRAEEQYRQAVRMFPQSSVAHWAFGDFLASTDRGVDEAESLLRKAIKLDEEDDIAYYHYGRALLRWERWQEARTVLERARELGNDSAAILLKTPFSSE